MAVETKKNLVGGLVNKKPASQLKEQKREDNAWKNKLFGYLEGFKKSFESLTTGKKVKGEGIFGKLLGGLAGGLKGWISKLFPIGLLAAIPAFFLGGIAKLGIGALIVGGIVALVMRVRDGFGAWAKAEAGEWGSVDKISAWIGGFLGGQGRGLWNALKVGGTWAIAGMMAGIAFGPPGMIIGAIIGGVIGGLLGWVGGQKIANWVDGTVKKMRSIFDMPEFLSDAQVDEAEKAKKEAQLKAFAAADRISMYKLEMQKENTTYLRRIELRKLISADEKVLEDNKDIARTESRRLAESELGYMDKQVKAQDSTTEAARVELQKAEALKNQAWIKVLWARAIHGEGSDEHKKAVELYDQRVQGVKDSKQFLADNVIKLNEMSVERKALRIELDKEHTTAMGNVRLFFAAETDWQKNFKESFTQMGTSIKTWFRTNIYDPGQAGRGGSGGGRPMRIFGVELKMPELSFPSWQEIKAALPWWLGGGGAEGGVTKVFKDHFFQWKWDLPSWEDAKKQMPKWLGGTVDAVESAGKVIAGVVGVFGTAFDEWKLDVPSWEETKKSLPTWLGGTGSIGETVELALDTFKNWEFKLPAWGGVGGIKELLPWWLGGGPEGTKTLFQRFQDEFSDTTWTFTIPSWATLKTFIPTWAGGTKGETLEEIAKPFASWTFTLPDFGALFKKYIYDPGTPGRAGSGGGTPMKIFGVALVFPKLDWNADDIWNALPMWIRDPIQFIKDNLPDLGKAAEKAKAKVIDTGEAVVEGTVVLAQEIAGAAGEVLNSVGTSITQFFGGGGATGPKVDPVTAISAGGKAQLQVHEGFREKAYDDTVGKKTIGYGFNLEKGSARERLKDAGIRATLEDLIEGRATITEEQADKLMQRDLKTAKKDAERFSGRSVWKELNQEMKDVLVNMAYNLGGGKLAEFKDLQAAVKSGNWGGAAAAMRDSKWAEQVGDRSEDLATIVEAIGHSEPHLRTDIGMMLKANPSAMGALLRGYGGGGGGITTVNNVTVAPQTSTSVASTNISENRYGTVDPYTNAVGAFN